MQRIGWLSILLLCFTCIQEIKAEIEEIVVTWNAFKCQPTCVEQIQQELSGIKGVKNLKINASAGAATMEWNSTYPLSYEPFRYASAAVGIKIISMRVRVKGKISHDSGHVYLISDRDGSRFHLIGPISTEPGRYIPKYNLDTHPLLEETKEQLLVVEKSGRSVVISGPLFLPSFYPLTLVTEQINIPE
jgi:copper chaperone CopZ